MTKKSKMIVLLSALLVAETTGLVLREQKQNRINYKTEVICNGTTLTLNADEFKDHRINIQEELDKYAPTIELIEEEPEEGSNLEYLGNFLLTGYCDCEICQEEWVGTTAIGVAPTENNTIAVDPDIIPLGSYVWINGTRYHAEDVGGMINEYHIDIFCGSHEECYSNFCNGYADVYIER